MCVNYCCVQMMCTPCFLSVIIIAELNLLVEIRVMRCKKYYFSPLLNWREINKWIWQMFVCSLIGLSSQYCSELIIGNTATLELLSHPDICSCVLSCICWMGVNFFMRLFKGIELQNTLKCSPENCSGSLLFSLWTSFRKN